MNNINLICLPYAGGCSNVYRNYFSDLGPNITLCPIELPGRGKRFMEARLETFIDVIADVMDQIKPIVDTGQPYALFGYSMGSTIIFELYYRLMLLKYPAPKHMFFCASRPPVVNYQFQSLEEVVEHFSDKKDIINVHKKFLNKTGHMIIIIPMDSKLTRMYYESFPEKNLGYRELLTKKETIDQLGKIGVKPIKVEISKGYVYDYLAVLC